MSAHTQHAERQERVDPPNATTTPQAIRNGPRISLGTRHSVPSELKELYDITCTIAEDMQQRGVEMGAVDVHYVYISENDSVLSNGAALFDASRNLVTLCQPDNTCLVVLHRGTKPLLLRSGAWGSTHGTPSSRTFIGIVSAQPVRGGVLMHAAESYMKIEAPCGIHLRIEAEGNLMCLANCTGVEHYDQLAVYARGTVQCSSSFRTMRRVFMDCESLDTCNVHAQSTREVSVHARMDIAHCRVQIDECDAPVPITCTTSLTSAAGCVRHNCIQVACGNVTLNALWGSVSNNDVRVRGHESYANLHALRGVCDNVVHVSGESAWAGLLSKGSVPQADTTWKNAGVVSNRVVVNGQGARVACTGDGMFSPVVYNTVTAHGNHCSVKFTMDEAESILDTPGGEFYEPYNTAGIVQVAHPSLFDMRGNAVLLTGEKTQVLFSKGVPKGLITHNSVRSNSAYARLYACAQNTWGWHAKHWQHADEPLYGRVRNNFVVSSVKPVMPKAYNTYINTPIEIEAQSS